MGGSLGEAEAIADKIKLKISSLQEISSHNGLGFLYCTASLQGRTTKQPLSARNAANNLGFRPAMPLRYCLKNTDQSFVLNKPHY